MEEPFSIENLAPSDLPLYMTDMWLGMLSHSLENGDCLAQFREETGNTWRPGKTAIDRAIDVATKADQAFLTQYINWFNKRVWGPTE